MIAYLWVFLASLVGGVIQATLGFGFGIISMSIFPFLMADIPAAAAATAFISMICSAVVLVKYYRQVRLKYVIPTLIANFCIMPICTSLSTKLPTRELSLALGVTMMLLCAFYVFWQKSITVKPTVVNSALAGGVGGVLGGLFSLGGIPVGVYLINAVACKDVYYATMQAYIVISDIYGTAVRIFSGIITLDSIPWFAAGIVGMLGGVLIGKRIYTKLNQAMLKKLVYLFIGLSGLYKVILYFV